MSEHEYFFFPLAYAVAHAAYATREGHPEEHLSKAFPKSYTPTKAATDYYAVPFVSELKLLRVHPWFVAFTFGTNTVVVGFTGTNDTVSTMHDANFSTTQATFSVTRNKATRKTFAVGFHRGFLERARTMFPDVEKVIQPYLNNKSRIIFTGHSLGGATAAIVTFLTFLEYPQADIWPCEALSSDPECPEDAPPGECLCFGFGSPVPGDNRLANTIEQLGLRRVFYTIVNNEDAVPRLYNVYSGFIERATRYLFSGGPQSLQSTSQTVGGSVHWNHVNANATSPTFGTYVFLDDPSQEVFIRLVRDRDATRNMLAIKSGSMTEHGRPYYGYRLDELRRRALDAAWCTPARSKIKFPVGRREITHPNMCSWTHAVTGLPTLMVGYNLQRRSVYALNWSTADMAVCFVIQTRGLISVQDRQRTTVVGLGNGLSHVHCRVSAASSVTIIAATASVCNHLPGCESEIINDEALRKVDRNVMPCVTRIATISTAGTGKAFVCLSLNALPDNGVRVLTLRHTSALDQIFLLKLPKDKFPKLRFTLENCTATRSEASTDAKTKVFVTVPAGLDGYAVLGEYSAQDIESSDWDFVAVKAASSVRTAR